MTAAAPHTPAAPVVPPSNAVLTARGHDEKKLGRKLTYCVKCKAKKPARGGWQNRCPAASGDT